MVLVVATLSAPTAANAGAATIIGAGALSCGQWLTDRQGQGRYGAETLEMWITGYLSGVDAYAFHRELRKGADSAGLFAWIDDYCHAHPLDDIAVATDRLIDALKAR
jgi:hypothetical protein